MFDSLVQPNSYVQVEYSLRDEEGEVIDSSSMPDGEPIRYVHGYEMLVPGLEKALVGMRAGEEKDIVIAPEEGYGVYDEELIFALDREDLPEDTDVEVGDELVAQGQDGDEVDLRVLELREDEVVVDGNHPLAGKTLWYSIKVLSVRPATEAEIEEAARAYDEARAEDAAEEAREAGLVPARKEPVLN